MSKDFVPKPGRLMDQVREVMRFHHYSFSTEKSYIHWILRYIRFNDRRHPKDMGKPEIERFLSHLAMNRDRFSLYSESGFERHLIPVS